MAKLLTKSGMQKLLTKIMETGGLTEEMEDDIKKISDDFNEREGELKKYGETYDGEDMDEYEYEGKTIEIDSYESKYNELKDKYYKRFFGGGESTDDDDITTPQKIMDDETADTKRDGEHQTINDLLTKVEG